MRNNQLTAEILKPQLGADELASALSHAELSGTDLLDELTKNGHDKLFLFSKVAEHFGMNCTELTPMLAPPSAADLIPEETARRYKVVPIRRDGGELFLAFGDPMDVETMDTLRYLFNEPVNILAALPEQIDQTLEQIYSAGELPPSVPKTITPASNPEINIKDDDEPITKLVNLIIQEGYRQRASDIHLEPLSDSFRVRYRIDGALQEVEGPPRRLHPSVISRIKIMADMKIAEKRLPQDGRIEINIENRPLDLRVSSIPTNHGESIVLRILDKQNLVLGLPHLGFQPDDLNTFERLIQYPDGILLTTGPTGSGKTTTLYACLNHLNRPDRKIITVEDPVEYLLTGVNQVHVRADIGLTFSAALRSILRQAPNTIMIGEIRDRETAEIAVNAALTGHLVLSTLHTNDAPSAVTRLADIGIKPFLISSSVRGIVAQRLIRTICPACKTAYTPNETEQKLAGSVIRLYRGDGCPACTNSGYAGRNGIFELLNVNDAIRELIHSGAPSSLIRKEARSMGMHSLREDGIRKAVDGMSTLSEVLRVTMKDEI
jgi:type II secretory ATPase GspE/PulE/Tfp pilus assembly ATPase PilB-like protein